MKRDAIDRRRALQHLASGLALTAAGGGALFGAGCQDGVGNKNKKASGGNVQEAKKLFAISLAEWSLHRALNGNEMTNLDFPKVAKETYGIEAIEFVNGFFKDKAEDHEYLTELKKRADDLGVRCLLIMCDGEGALGDADEAKRTTAVENHYRWVEAAKFLGCHSIRVNAASGGSYEEQMSLAADGLRRLTTFAEPFGLNVIVENHGGLSSNGAWLAGVMKEVGMDTCGTLPDFGNFHLGGGKW